MKRRQLFEFTDLTWWPQPLKRLLTDFLHLYTILIKPFDPKLDLLGRALARSKSNTIIDLCSGSGGPWPQLLHSLNPENDQRFQVILTDLNPNTALVDRLRHDPRFRYHTNAIDARKVPSELSGCRTIFDGFHHFPPEQATRILQDAVANRDPIVVFEILRRTIPDLVPMLFAFVHVWILTPFIKPFSFTRIFLTYAIPLAPLLIAFDGAVSILRCYTPEELLQMAKSTTGADQYEWHSGDYKKWGLFPVTYLVGYPRDEIVRSA